MKINYEIINDAISQNQVIKATFLDSNIVMVIPMDEANSDYQAYLNKDKPQVEHLTEIPTPPAE